MLVFMFAFGVTTQALLFPNQALSAVVLGNVFLPAWFLLSGDNYIIRGLILSDFDGILS